MVKQKSVESAEEAIGLLRDLMNTPQMCELHFEFDCSIGYVPYVQYQVKRYVVKEEENHGEHDSD